MSLRSLNLITLLTVMGLSGCNGANGPAFAPSTNAGASKAIRTAASCVQETYLGGNVFTPCDVFVTNYSQTPIDPDSAQIIRKIAKQPLEVDADYAGSSYGWALNWNVYDGSQALWAVGMYDSPDACGSASSGCMPWGDSYVDEPCCGDHHGFVYQTNVGAWEAYGVDWTPPSGPLKIYGQGGTGNGAPGHYWNMNASLVSQYAPQEHSDGASASDTPFIAGTLISDRDCCNTPSEPATPNHAMLLFGALGSDANGTQWVRPAGAPISNSGACEGRRCSAALLVYSDHFRLHATQTLNRRLQRCIKNRSCPQTASIVAALQVYGAFLSDGASQWGLAVSNGSSGGGMYGHSNLWSPTDLANLSLIKMSDFDILDRNVMGGLICPGEPHCKKH